FSGKKFHNLIQDPFQKSKCFLLGTINIAMYSPKALYLIGPAGTTELRVSSQCCLGMAGHFYFGNNGNKALLRIFNYFLYFLLRIKPSVTGGIPFSRFILVVS